MILADQQINVYPYKTKTEVRFSTNNLILTFQRARDSEQNFKNVFVKNLPIEIDDAQLNDMVCCLTYLLG